MHSRKNQSPLHLSILEAVEALEEIADLEFERDVDHASMKEINEHNKQVTLRAVKWIGKEDPDETAGLIKETFHIVLNYLRNFYRHQAYYARKTKIVEGMKTIMVLVGEAAQKLDKYTTLFKKTKGKSVKALQEYKQLQEFYLTRIARKIDQGIIGKWILELTKRAMARGKKERVVKRKRPISTKYVFIDLESVKKDTEYELFFLRKEDGTRFFNPRLIRNIKLVCDFGETIKKEKIEDPLEDIAEWRDLVIHHAAKEIVRAMGGIIDRFVHETKRSFRRELVADLNKALMALLLSCNPRNLLKNLPVKTCSEYFKDFHFFLRNALSSREYQRLMVYPPKKSARLALILLEMTHKFCQAIFTSSKGYGEIDDLFQKVFRLAKSGQSKEHETAVKKSKMLWNALACDYAAIKKVCKNHPNGPLKKVLDVIEQGAYHMFDPIAQLNIPSQLFSLYLNTLKMTNIRMPTPTKQEFIHKADVLEEFKGFLRSYAKGQLKRKHLVINFQDRTSWREHIRAVSIEDLRSNRQFLKSFAVVTLAKNTEFYHQTSTYREDHQAQAFKQNFKEHLGDEKCGFYFPKAMKKKLLPHFTDPIIEAIHKIFFAGRNVLTVNARRDFIEIFYFFLQLKILEMEKPDTFSFMCKDGIDKAGPASVQLYALLIILRDKKFSEKEVAEMNIMLHVPSLLLRERVVSQDSFDRMVSAIKRVEDTKAEHGSDKFLNLIRKHFSKHYETKILTNLIGVAS